MNEEDYKILCNAALAFNKNFLMAGTPDGTTLEMVVDPFNNHITWEVWENNARTEFFRFRDAALYYLKIGGVV